MKTWIKVTAGVAIAIAGLVAAVAAVGPHLADQKAQRYVEVPVQAVAIPTDAKSIERGRYLFASRACVECHAIDGSGREFANDGKGLRLRGANITPAGAVAKYDAVDWVRSIRHGVAPNGRPLLIMPSEDYNRLTDADLGALIAYLKQIPAVQSEGAVLELSPVVKTLYAAGVIRDAAEKIDHKLPPSKPVPEAVSVEHGAYVANMCIGCHGATFSGGKIPGAPPEWPAAANLTPGDKSSMLAYATPEQFAAMMKSAKRPDGSEVSPVMPFIALKELNDTDVRALYAYLKQLPARPLGER